MSCSVTIKYPMEDKEFLIDQWKLIYHDIMMEIPEITGFSYGSTENKQGGTLGERVFHFNFIDSSGDEIKISFQNNLFAWSSETVYKTMSFWVWHYLSGRIYNNILGALRHGIPFTVGEVHINEEGLSFGQHSYSPNPEMPLIRWNELIHENYGSAFVIRSQSRPEIHFMQDMMAYNAQVFTSFMDSIQRDKSIISQFGTRKNPSNPYEKRT